MSLPAPNLDSRKFQEIVDDVKRQIGLRCPEWTEHNVSDPGVTLLELFAYMTEMALFRLNQVPEKNYIKFLEMLGISLEMPEPARTQLRFSLSRPIENVDGGEDNEILLRANEVVASTLRTDNEEAIEFTIEHNLSMVRPRLSWMLAMPAQNQLPPDDIGTARKLDFDSDGTKIYSDQPTQGDCLYFGFENDVSANVVELALECVTAAAVGLNEDYPAQVWEYWDNGTGGWERAEIVEDTTRGFNRDGRVVVAMPRPMADRNLGGQRGHWIRVRYTTSPDDLPPRGIEQVVPDPYEASPELISVRARTIGGTASGANATVVRGERLGLSDGTPGQVFKLRYSPVLRPRPDETLIVGALGIDEEEWVEWTQVADFSESNADDLHFVLDGLTGEVLLGPSILQPDGSNRQYGAIPEKGMSLAFRSYRIGGGTEGNVREGKIRILKSAIPYIADVSNPIVASGGQDLETLERAKLRTKEVLRIRNRAVTCEDYEFLAGKASSGVGRAHCIQPTTHPARSKRPLVRPGTVRVLLIPQLSSDLLAPRPIDLRVPSIVVDEVTRYLDERRLLTATLDVGEPEYVFLSTEIRLVADPRANPETVARRVEEALFRFFHPLTGGPSGDGWPFRRTITLADIYATVGSIKGVAFLLDARISSSRIQNKEDGLLGLESVVSNAEGLPLADGEMVCSRNHTIRVVPMSSVGAEEAASRG